MTARRHTLSSNIVTKSEAHVHNLIFWQKVQQTFIGPWCQKAIVPPWGLYVVTSLCWRRRWYFHRTLDTRAVTSQLLWQLQRGKLLSHKSTWTEHALTLSQGVNKATEYFRVATKIKVNIEKLKPLLQFNQSQSDKIDKEVSLAEVDLSESLQLYKMFKSLNLTNNKQNNNSKLI